MALAVDSIGYLAIIGGGSALKNRLDKQVAAPLLTGILSYSVPGLAASAAGVTLPSLSASRSVYTLPLTLKTRVQPFVTQGGQALLVTSVYQGTQAVLKYETEGLSRYGHMYISGFSAGVAGMALSSQNYVAMLLKMHNPQGYKLFSSRPYLNLLRAMPADHIWQGMTKAYPRAFTAAALAGVALKATKSSLS